MTGSRPRTSIAVFACLAIIALVPTLAAAESVSCVGDSITEGHLPPQVESKLESATGQNWAVHDNGIGGYTTFDLRDAMGAGCWWCSRPTYTIIMAGTNDMVHSLNIDSSVSAMQDMVNMMRRGSGRIVVSLIIPSLSVSETTWAQRYNQRMQERLSGVDYFIKTNWDEFYNPDTGTARGEFMRDRLHPNETGDDMISTQYAEVVLSRQADPCTEKVNNYR